MSQLQQASSNAFTLALETAWTDKSTIEHLLQKAHNMAHILALEKNIYTKDTIKQLLSKANASMLSIAATAKDALDDDLKEKIT